MFEKQTKFLLIQFNCSGCDGLHGDYVNKWLLVGPAGATAAVAVAYDGSAGGGVVTIQCQHLQCCFQSCCLCCQCSIGVTVGGDGYDAGGKHKVMVQQVKASGSGGACT